MSYKLPPIILLLFFVFNFSEAQKWCPAGATWYFQEYYSYYPGGIGPPISLAGYDKAEYAKDTLLNNQNCKVITDTSYYEGTAPVRANAAIYTYSSGDTVYFWRDSLFLPTFYFGCHTGDTLWVPWSSIKVATQVDSTGIMVINGDSLRFYDYRAIDSIYACVNVIGGPSNGRIVERLGNVTVGPENNSFSFGFTCLEYQMTYFLHCYRDDSFADYSSDSTRPCTYYISAVNDLASQSEISLSPNPSNGHCKLQISSAGETFTAGVYDVTGKEILPLFRTEGISDFEFDISNLSPGIYFVKVNDSSGRMAVRKLVKD